MKKGFLAILKYAFFLGLGIFLVWWSIHKMDDKNWEDCKKALQSANYALFIPVFFIISASHLSRAMRWRILMKPMGYSPGLRNTFFAVMIGYLANLAIPRLGEVLKCTILGKYEKVPPDKLVGTILVERLVDVICLGIVFAVAIVTQAELIGQFAKDTINKYFLQGGTAALVTRLLVLLLILAAIVILMRFVFSRFKDNSVIARVKILFSGVRTGIASIKNLENKTAFIGHSVFIWCCYLGGTYLGFFATAGTDTLPLASVFPVLAFASIGMIITPGGIGSYPHLIKEVMMLYNVEEGIAYANGTLQWVAQSAIVLVVGFICLILLPYFNKDNEKPAVSLYKIDETVE